MVDKVHFDLSQFAIPEGCRSGYNDGKLLESKVVNMRFLGIIAACAALVLLSTAPPAVAQSRHCLPLQMELAELQKSSPGSARGSSAARRELREARRAERRAGCRSFFSRNRSSKTCRSIRQRISQLERRVGSRRGGFFSSRSPVERRRAQIRRALARAGCATYARSYRTICVRVCDGYYFPLSNTSSRQRFTQDAQKCLAQYPPGEAELFYHPFPHGDASQAVSLSGDRYFEKPYAFAFRKTFVPYCASRLQAGLAALRERVYAAVPSILAEQFEAAVEARMATFSVPIPIPRVDFSSDPETVANRAGDFQPRPILRQEEGIASIRTVGDPLYAAETKTGPPPTVAGYEPPELTDFRVPQRATILPAGR